MNVWLVLVVVQDKVYHGGTVYLSREAAQVFYQDLEATYLQYGLEDFHASHWLVELDLRSLRACVEPPAPVALAA